MQPALWYNNKNTILKLLLIVVGFVWSLYIYYPGSYSMDTWAQYTEMMTNSYSDWHSPILALLWKLLYICTGAWQSIFFFQVAWYWLFVAMVLIRTGFSNLLFIAGYLYAIFFLFIAQYIMKDSHFALACGTAAIIVITDKTPTQNKLAKWIGLLLLVYAAFLRMNCIIAILPLILLYTYYYFTPKKGVLINLIAALVICILAFAGYYTTTYKVLNAERAYPEYKLELLDIAGITKLSSKDYMPPCISSYKYYNAARIMRLYNPATFDDIYWPKDHSPSMIPVPDSSLAACVTYAWKHAVLGEPMLYLENRGDGFLYYLRIKKRFTNSEYHNIGIWNEPENPFHLTTTNNKFTRIINRLYYKLAFTPFFDPWFWLLLNTVLCIHFFMRYYKLQHADFYFKHSMVQLSGILFMLSQFPVYQHDRDFRYNYWNVFVFFIGLTAFFVPKKQIINQV